MERNEAVVSLVLTGLLSCLQDDVIAALRMYSKAMPTLQPAASIHRTTRVRNQDDYWSSTLTSLHQGMQSDNCR